MPLQGCHMNYMDHVKIEQMFSSLPSAVLHFVLQEMNEDEIGCIYLKLSAQWKSKMQWILIHYFPKHPISQILQGSFRVKTTTNPYYTYLLHVLDYSYYQYLDIEMLKLVQNQATDVFHLMNAIKYNNKVIVRYLLRDFGVIEMLSSPYLYLLCMMHKDIGVTVNHMLRNSHWVRAARNFCQYEIDSGGLYIACDQYDKLKSHFRPRLNTTLDEDKKFWKDINTLNQLANTNIYDNDVDVITLRDQEDDHDAILEQSILYFFANIVLPREIKHHGYIYINEKNLRPSREPSDQFLTDIEQGMCYYGYIWGFETMGESLLFVTGPKTKAVLCFMVKDDNYSNLTDYGRNVFMQEYIFTGSLAADDFLQAHNTFVGKAEQYYEFKGTVNFDKSDEEDEEEEDNEDFLEVWFTLIVDDQVVYNSLNAELTM
jgi:hypothetical protein